MILILLTDNCQTDSLNQLAGSDLSRTSLHACHAGQAKIQGLGRQKRLEISVFNHADELMRMILHLIICRTGSGTFAALHALARIDTADP